jgi:hypothetical protein
MSICKNSGDNFFMEKVYHIYAKDRCLMHSIKEEEFSTVWNTLNNLVGIMKTDYEKEDLTYEEISFNKEIPLNSSY